MRDELESVAGAAFILGVDTATVRRELDAGRLSGKRADGSWQILKDAVYDYMTGHGRSRDLHSALLDAEHRFQSGEIDEGIRALVVGCGDPALPHEIRNVLLGALATLTEACGRRDPAQTRAAQVSEAIVVQRYSALGLDSGSLDVAEQWNLVVREASSALRHHERTSPISAS